MQDDGVPDLALVLIDQPGDAPLVRLVQLGTLDVQSSVEGRTYWHALDMPDDSFDSHRPILDRS
jgi:hypothetical protein